MSGMSRVDRMGHRGMRHAMEMEVTRGDARVAVVSAAAAVPAASGGWGDDAIRSGLSGRMTISADTGDRRRRTVARTVLVLMRDRRLHTDVAGAAEGQAGR